MELTSVKKAATVLGLSAMLAFGAVACSNSDDTTTDAGATASSVADDAAATASSVVENAAETSTTAADDMADEEKADDEMADDEMADDEMADEEKADDEMADDDMADEDVAAGEKVDPATASVEDITAALETAGVPTADAATIAETIKDGAPYADEAALKAALPDVDEATFTLVASVVHVGA